MTCLGPGVLRHWAGERPLRACWLPDPACQESLSEATA